MMMMLMMMMIRRIAFLLSQKCVSPTWALSYVLQLLFAANNHKITDWPIKIYDNLYCCYKNIYKTIYIMMVTSGIGLNFALIRVIIKNFFLLNFRIFIRRLLDHCGIIDSSFTLVYFKTQRTFYI